MASVCGRMVIEIENMEACVLFGRAIGCIESVLEQQPWNTELQEAMGHMLKALSMLDLRTIKKADD